MADLEGSTVREGRYEEILRRYQQELRGPVSDEAPAITKPSDSESYREEQNYYRRNASPVAAESAQRELILISTQATRDIAWAAMSGDSQQEQRPEAGTVQQTMGVRA